MIVVYIIAGVLALAMAITSWIAIMKIQRLLDEVVESGAMPIVLIKRAKKHADRMLVDGVIYDHKKFVKTCQILTEVDGSEEAVQLVSQLNELEDVKHERKEEQRNGK